MLHIHLVIRQLGLLFVMLSVPGQGILVSVARLDLCSMCHASPNGSVATNMSVLWFTTPSCASFASQKVVVLAAYCLLNGTVIIIF